MNVTPAQIQIQWVLFFTKNNITNIVCIEHFQINCWISTFTSHEYKFLWWTFLPSATKLRRLCFYTCVWFFSRGGSCYPRMHCRWYPSMSCSGGCLLLGVSALGGVYTQGVPARGVPARGMPALGDVYSGGLLPGRGGVETPVESRRLLLRTVRILLECILLSTYYSISNSVQTEKVMMRSA